MYRGWPSSRLADLGFCLINDALEAFGIVDRDFREHFTVQADVGLGGAVDEGAVVHAVLLGRRGNPGNPEGTEYTFFISAVTVCIF